MANPASVLTPGDIAAPAAPTTVVVPYARGLQVTMSIVTRPSDFLEYYIEKRISAPAGSATAFGGWRFSRDGTEIDYETVYGLTYEYRALSRDTTLNQSAFGNTASGTPNQLTGGDIASASIVEAHIVNAEITSAKIRNANILEAHILNGEITNAKIRDGAITRLKVVDGEIINAKIANGAIDNLKVQDGQILNAKIANLAVDTIKIAGSAVTTDRINANAVTQTVSDFDAGNQSTTSTSPVRYAAIAATISVSTNLTLMLCTIKCELAIRNDGPVEALVRADVSLRVSTGSPTGQMAKLSGSVFIPPGVTASLPFSFTHVDGPRSAVSTQYEIWFNASGATTTVFIFEPALQVTEIKR